MSMHLAKDLSPIYPACLIIDAGEERAQRLARLLTLADYRPLVVSTLSQALERFLREPFQPYVLLLGQADLRHHPVLATWYVRSKKGMSTTATSPVATALQSPLWVRSEKG